MQKTIEFTFENKKYTSKPFDFKAMCMINEKHCNPEVQGAMTSCADTVSYMFEGTDGQEVLKKAEPAVMARLCMKAWDIYQKNMEAAAKNE